MKADRKTVRFVRLMSGFNVGQWLGQILEYLAVSVDMKIRIGFSFLGVKYKQNEPEYIYFYAAADLCEIEETFTHPVDAIKFARDLEKYTHRDYLQQTFLASQSDNIFSTSGIGPHILVASYIWITK